MPNPSRGTPSVSTVLRGPAQGDQRTFVRSNTPADINGALQDVWTWLHQQQQNAREQTAAIAAIPPAPTAAETNAALSQGGTNPLNVSGLAGQLTQVQPAAIPIVTALPSPFQSQQDQVVFMGGHIYHFNATPSPGAWTQVL